MKKIKREGLDGPSCPIHIPEKGDKLRYASSTKEDREVVVRLGTDGAHVTSCWPDRTKQLIKKYGLPDEVTLDREGKVASAHWALPDLITFRSPKKSKPPTEAQIKARAAAGERLSRSKKAA